MPMYELRNAYVPSYSLNSSSADSASEPPTVALSISYTTIKPTYLRDAFDFSNGQDAHPDFEWIEIKRPPEPSTDQTPVPYQRDPDAQIDTMNARFMETQDDAALIVDDVFMF